MPSLSPLVLSNVMVYSEPDFGRELLGCVISACFVTDEDICDTACGSAGSTAGKLVAPGMVSFLKEFSIVCSCSCVLEQQHFEVSPPISEPLNFKKPRGQEIC